MDWGKKWLVDFNAGKTQLVSFDRSNNNGFIDVKMGWSVLEGKSFSKMLELTSLLNFIWALTLSLFLKLGFTPYKAEQPLRGMVLQEKESQKDCSIQEICIKRTYI